MNPPHTRTTPRWDIFCSVVDNYGDIGICWRLARQLVAEHGQRVRLWVDNLESFRHIAPEVEPDSATQLCRGVEVCHWPALFPPLAPDEVGDVVIEALACTLPPAFIDAMAARARQPLWLNLEYLSAETWVAGCHGLASPHPQLPLTKYFFFPGFVPGTGGLLRERGLLEQRRSFQADPVAQTVFWDSLGLPSPAADELYISLFAYGSADLDGLISAWAEGNQPLRCLVPEGALAQALGRQFGRETVQAGDAFGRGNLQVHVFPLLEQGRYDRLLWACDINFVRGEDSFIRAQWAGRPLVWQPYRQEEGAHRPKLEAFLQRYCAGLPPTAAAALGDCWHAWDRESGVAGAWPPFLAQREVMGRHAEEWIAQIAAQGDLASNLMLFYTKHL